MASNSAAASRTVRAIGPMWSSDHDNGIAPARLTRPYVGLSPTMPQHAAGRRIEPPVSEPSAPKASRAANATPEPDDEPPAQWPTFHGFCASPWWALSPKGPRASSVMFSLPSVIAPARARRATAVHSTGDTKYSAVFVPQLDGSPGTAQRSL